MVFCFSNNYVYIRPRSAQNRFYRKQWWYIIFNLNIFTSSTLPNEGSVFTPASVAYLWEDRSPIHGIFSIISTIDEKKYLNKY